MLKKKKYTNLCLCVSYNAPLLLYIKYNISTFARQYIQITKDLWFPKDLFDFVLKLL